jgi:hypothetical protein
MGQVHGALGLTVVLLIVDGLGWRAVAACSFDCEWLVTGTRTWQSHLVETETAKGATERRARVPATLKLTRHLIGVGVRRGPFDIVVDGKRVGSIEAHDTIEAPVEPGRHTLQVRKGQNSSRTQTFDAAEGQVVAFRCNEKRFLPIFLVSFVVPSLAISLRRGRPWIARLSS